MIRSTARWLSRLLPAALAATLMPTEVVAKPPTSPKQHLGRSVGTDFELADWDQLAAYVDRLGGESPRVQVQKVGKTTEGRDFRVAFISSEANLQRLPELKKLARRIADPRGMTKSERNQLLEQARVFVFVSCNMHSTEIAAAEMSLQLMWLLASSDDEPWASIREEAVIMVAPSLNPDGMDRVVKWYRSIKGTPYESARLPELYQWYAGHDNNRDWFMASLKETQLVTRLLYTELFPQIYWDVHQQGRHRERLFFPPFRDPLNPNLDPGIMTGIGALGSRVMHDMTRAGLPGVSSGVSYDMWWNGGNRNVPVRHNVVGLLSEAASANLASPIFIAPPSLGQPGHMPGGYRPSNRFPMPWKGGWWRIGDIIEYELAVARSLFASVGRERRSWLELSLEAAERTMQRGLDEAPYAWLLPVTNVDRGATRRLVSTLLLQGIEVEIAGKPFTADSVEYPAGTVVLRRAQPYGGFLKDIFEIQRYPEGLPPYDVTGWTVPLLLGVHRVEISQPFEVETKRVDDTKPVMANIVGPEREDYPWPHLPGDDSDSDRAVIALLEQGVRVHYDAQHDSAAPGAWVLGRGQVAKARRVLRKHDIKLARANLSARGRERGRGTPSAVPGMLSIERLPRVALYAPWTANMDEGWTRWLFDTYGLPYTRIRNETVRGGKLGDKFDVVVIPSVEARTLRRGRPEGSVFPRYAGGLDPEGSMALHQFVRDGGTLIAFNRATDYVVDLFDLGVEDAAREAGEDGEQTFSAPGSVLRALPDEFSPWTAGLPASQPLFFASGRALVPAPDSEVTRVETLMTFPETGTLLSGFIRKPEQIAGSAAWIRATEGEGQVHAFGFSPQFRSWSQTTFRLLFRAILLPSQRPAASKREAREQRRERRRDRRE